MNAFSLLSCLLTATVAKFELKFWISGSQDTRRVNMTSAYLTQHRQQVRRVTAIFRSQEFHDLI